MLAATGMGARANTESRLNRSLAARLTQAILGGTFAPGQRLNESQLSRDFRVSRAPIREALRGLEEQGLVLNHPRRGMFVVQLSAEEIQKINSVRIVLEAEAMRLARLNRTQESVERLNALAAKIEDRAPTRDRVRLDFEFHRIIWRLSGNEFLEKTLAALVAPVFAHGLLQLRKKNPQRMHSHRDLVDYIEGRSDRPAEEHLEEHLRIYW